MDQDERLPASVIGDRLTIRHWRPNDLAVLRDAIAASREHLRPWMAWIAVEPVPDADRLAQIRSWRLAWEAGGDSVYGVFVGDAVVGGCGLHRRSVAGVLDIGYWVHVDHLRRGYAQEIASKLTTAAFTVPRIERVEIHHDEANTRSRAVPERLGFLHVGSRPDERVAPGELGVDVAWAITREAWGVGPRREWVPD